MSQLNSGIWQVKHINNLHLLPKIYFYDSGFVQYKLKLNFMVKSYANDNRVTSAFSLCSSALYGVKMLIYALPQFTPCLWCVF